MMLGFAFYCSFCVYKPEFLASTYFIREQYGFKVRLLFRVLAAIWGIGAYWWAIQEYIHPTGSFGPGTPNLFISVCIGFGIALFCFLFVRSGRAKRLGRRKENSKTEVPRSARDDNFLK